METRDDWSRNGQVILPL